MLPCVQGSYNVLLGVQILNDSFLLINDFLFHNEMNYLEWVLTLSVT